MSDASMPQLPSAARARSASALPSVARLHANLPALRGESGGQRKAAARQRKAAAASARGVVGGDREGAGRAKPLRNSGGNEAFAAASKSRPEWLKDFIAALPLAWLESRVKEDEMGCWIWQNKVSGSQARITFWRDAKTSVALSIHRLVYEMAHGKQPASRMPCACTHHALCVHPEHVRLSKKTLTQEHRRRAGEGIAKARRARSRFSEDDVAMIRASNDSCANLALRFACHRGTISKIRLGAARKPLAPSVFAGMGGGWRS